MNHGFKASVLGLTKTLQPCLLCLNLFLHFSHHKAAVLCQRRDCSHLGFLVRVEAFLDLVLIHITESLDLKKCMETVRRNVGKYSKPTIQKVKGQNVEISD